MEIKRIEADLPRKSYSFPEGTINWREVQPDPFGGWPGIYGNVETQQIVTHETAGSVKTVLGRSVYHPGEFHEPHLHFNAEEFIYCLSGKCIVGAGDKEYLFTPGDTQFAPIGTIHWLRNPFDEPVEFIWKYTGAAMPFESGYATNDLFNEGMEKFHKNEIPE
jgi:quercetin dioxygenase-like cupin family protein